MVKRAVIAAAILLGYLPVNVGDGHDHTSMVPHVAPKPRFEAKNPMDTFLDHIAFLESTNGKNTHHKALRHGLHAGTSAIGEYGMMPITAKEVAKKSKNTYVKALAPLPPAKVAQVLSNDEELSREVAREYARKLARRFKNDQVLMAYAWRMGPDNNIEEAASHPYVQAFLAESK